MSIQFSDDWLSANDVRAFLQNASDATLKDVAIKMGVKHYYLIGVRNGSQPVSEHVAKHFGFEVYRVFRRKR